MTENDTKSSEGMNPDKPAIKAVIADSVQFRPSGDGSEQRDPAMLVSGDIEFGKLVASRKGSTDAGQYSHSAEILKVAVRGEYSYGKLGLILGLVSIVGGVILGINGVAGSTSWTTSFLGLKSEINDAAPGVVLFIVGLFMIFLTRPKVKLGKLEG
jgi:hypothetical protein